MPSASVVGTLLPEVAEEWGLTAGHQGRDRHRRRALRGGRLRARSATTRATSTWAPSSWLSCHLPAKRTDLLNNQAALPSAVPGRYFLANEHEVGGGALLWLRDQAQMVADVDEANDLAAVGPGRARTA